MKKRTSSITFRGKAARLAFEAITGTKIKPPVKYDLDLWNKLNPNGTACDLVLDDGTTMRTRTRSEAWLLGHGQAVVMVEGKSGGWMLERVKILETHKSP